MAEPHTPSRAPLATPLRSVLVVDEDEALRQLLTVGLAQAGYAATAAGSAAAARAELEQRRFDFILSDLRMPGLFGQELLEQVRQSEHPSAVILMSSSTSSDEAVLAIEDGAVDHLQKPSRAEEAILVLRKAEARLARSGGGGARRPAGPGVVRPGEPKGARAALDALDALVGDSGVMSALGRTIRKVAEHKTTILVTGESGTGKELVARAIHAASPRRDAPFVTVNCGAIPETLLESELFGHKKGAFTDAVRDKRGLFTEAHGGTLFLDEIGEMPLLPQVKLLRVLQEQQLRPLGATEDETVDVRVVAATMRDLAADVKDGRFREDLFYRLNVIEVHIPPLRERREDLPQLIEHFLARTNQRLGTRVHRVSPEAMKRLLAYSWPGNIRELENTIERSVVLCESDLLGLEGLPERLLQSRDAVREVLQSGELSIKKTVRIIEEELIRRALIATRGNRTNASKRLQISHRALLYKIKEFGIIEPAPTAAVRAASTKFDPEG